MLKGRPSIAVAVMAGLMLSIGAQCLAGQEMTTEQMACCAGVEHDCGGAAVAQDCCQRERAEQDQLITQIHQLVSPLVPVPVALDTLVPPLDSYRPAFHHDTTELHAASPPKYVLLASFLI